MAQANFQEWDMTKVVGVTVRHKEDDFTAPFTSGLEVVKGLGLMKY
jgi:hypothetical protein